MSSISLCDLVIIYVFCLADFLHFLTKPPLGIFQLFDVGLFLASKP